LPGLKLVFLALVAGAVFVNDVLVLPDGMDPIPCGDTTLLPLGTSVPCEQDSSWHMEAATPMFTTAANTKIRERAKRMVMIGGNGPGCDMNRLIYRFAENMCEIFLFT
jgi:hypothetical protein